PVPGLQEKTDNAFPRYSLYLYSEGAKKTSNFKLSGIPVLFIPGNAGSYRQVRSLGSVAITKAEESDYHFNYFSVDLNGEKNALYGGFLLEQTEFVHQCIRHILSFYSEAKNKPKSVVVVGHSMYWKANQEALNHVTLLSVGGGHRDIMVKSAATDLNGIVLPSRRISSVSMSVPHVWLAADHQCIVWCKELVLATKRALFDMIDPKTSLISEDAEHRMKVFRYHFTDHSGSKVYQGHVEDTIKFSDKQNLTFKIATDSRLHIAAFNKDKITYYLFPIPSSNHGFVATTKIPAARWIFLCTKATTTTCEEGIDITKRGRVVPPLKASVREIHLSPEELEGHKFVVVRVLSGIGGVINAEMYDYEDGNAVVTLPPFFSLQPQTVMNVTGKSYISMVLEDFTSVSTAYVAELVHVMCPSDVTAKINSTLRFEVPWKEEDTFSVAAVKDTNSLSLKLQSGRPPKADNESMPRLSVYMDPRCRYAVTLRYSHKEGYGQCHCVLSLCSKEFITDDIRFGIE
ncbi:hypothetical protein BSL78_25734, partial [Apostichopus japonicus]